MERSSVISLEEKVAVVTGSGRGLGRAYARALAAAGSAVVVNDVDSELASETARDIVNAGGKATPAVVAVGSTEAADQLVDRAVQDFGRLDVMCTNAGILRDRTLKNMTDEDFDLVVETHLRGTFTCGRSAVARFRVQGDGGRLILIGSPSGQQGSFGQTNYAASKAGIVAMAWTWAMELARDEITVNAVIPLALTRMAATIPGLMDAAEAAERGESIPVEMRKNGIGTADDVAPLIVFLASDASSGITGQVVGIGGDKLSLWSRPTEIVSEMREGGWDAESTASTFESLFKARLEAVKDRSAS
jgi:NAD(P)-dependent dehydrogenase (short-subunit alcohol dehydrogenase family)